jgi:hypothetical protein
MTTSVFKLSYNRDPIARSCLSVVENRVLGIHLAIIITYTNGGKPMGLLANIKTKLFSRHSFKKNELDEMGPGKIVKGKSKKGKKNVK